MSKFMIAFGANATNHLADEDMPAVAEAAHAVVQEILNAGVYVLAGGLENRRASVAETDGTVTDGPQRQAIAGVTIVDVPSREEALQWAAKVALACRCAQEVWAFGHDPELEVMIRETATRQ
jgi:hypothetical protein